MIDVTNAEIKVHDIVPGDPAAVDRLAARFAVLSRAASSAHTDLRSLRSEHWTGRGAERFRAAALAYPAEFESAEGAFTAASRATSRYADALRRGRDGATQAIRLAHDAAAASARWAAAGGVGEDPGAALVTGARTLAERAAEDTAVAASTTAAALRRLGAEAPRAATTGLLARSGATVGAVGVRPSFGHPLADAEQFASAPTGAAEGVRYGVGHPIDFAANDTGAPNPTSWSAWQQAGAERHTGEVTSAALGALAIGGGALRRRTTAFSTAGIDPATCPPIPARGGTGRVSTQGRTGWRTNLRPNTGRQR